MKIDTSLFIACLPQDKPKKAIKAISKVLNQKMVSFIVI